jgi:hypothetical protein
MLSISDEKLIWVLIKKVWVSVAKSTQQMERFNDQ